VATFPLGCPTDGVKAPEEDEPKWKRLNRVKQLRLINAAQILRGRKGKGTDPELRDHALIAALLGSGLWVSELLTIDVAEYDARGHCQGNAPEGLPGPPAEGGREPSSARLRRPWPCR
jgi:hypothetical protein